MDWERRCIRFCGWVLLCAALLRLAGSAAMPPALPAQALSFLVYLQTGRVVRLPAETVPVQPPAPTEPAPTAPEFTEADLELVDIKYNCSYRPDLAALLTAPVSFDLSADQPTVLILHTHTTESYTPTGSDRYEQTSPYRTLDPQYNMLCIGQRVAQTLEEAGIGVIHDRSFHDYPSYNGSYDHAAAATAEYLSRYPSIRLVLDLHRDAADTAYGQLATSCTIGGQEAAQLMLVVGTDEGGLTHPDWQENLSLALKLQVLLERQDPGVCRQTSLTYQRFNQHLAPGALLVEVGAAGNTLPEALLAADALARSILALFPPS